MCTLCWLPGCRYEWFRTAGACTRLQAFSINPTTLDMDREELGPWAWSRQGSPLTSGDRFGFGVELAVRGRRWQGVVKRRLLLAWGLTAGDRLASGVTPPPPPGARNLWNRNERSLALGSQTHRSSLSASV